MRATSPDGPFSSISGPVSGSSYSDTNIQQGTAYYYAVKPAQYSDTVSEVAEAIPDPFPSYLDAEIASYNSVNGPYNTAVKGDYLYVADYAGGLHVANISDPATPVPVTTYSLSSARDVFIDGNYAYLTHSGSLSVFNISTPSSPQKLDTIQVTTSQAEGVSIQGNWAFVACFNKGFSVVDISNKNSLNEVYEHSGTGYSQVYETFAEDRSGTVYFYIAGLNQSGIYKITGSAGSPAVTEMSTSMDGSDEIKVLGDYLYMASGWYVTVYDIGDTGSLSSPVKRDSDPADPSYSNPPEALDVANGRAYVAIRDTGFCVMDVSDPDNFALIQTYTTPGDPKGVTVSGDYVYISNGYGYGVSIFGIANPNATTLSDTYSSIGTGENITVFQDHLLITEQDNDYGFQVIDAEVPSNLSFSGMTSSYAPVDLKVVGQCAFSAGERMGISVYDISDFSAPQVLPPSYVDLPGGNSVAIDVIGNYAYVTTDQSKLNVVDISWQDSDGSFELYKVGSCDTQGNSSYAAVDIEVKGDYAFVANSAAGLRVVDVSNPKWPSAVSNFGSTTGNAVAVALIGDYAFVADDTAGLYIFNISNPESVSTVRSGGSEGAITDVVVRGNFAYIAKGASGVEMLNITDPSSPSSVLTFSGITATKLAINRDHLFAIDGTTDVYAVDLLP